MQRNALTVILLIVVVFAALWFVDSPPEQFQFNPDQNDEKPVLIRYINDVETYEFGEDGDALNRFTAIRVNHRAVKKDAVFDSGDAEFIEPKVTLYKDGAPKWQLQAQYGSSRVNEELLYLSNNVQGQQLTEEESWTFDTESLSIDTKNKNADTDKAISLQSDGILVEGIGMTANFENETLKILADSKTQYELKD